MRDKRKDFLEHHPNAFPLEKELQETVGEGIGTHKKRIKRPPESFQSEEADPAFMRLFDDPEEL